MATVARTTSSSLARASRRALPSVSSNRRQYATSIPAKPHHRVVVVGGGTAGVTAAAQLMLTKEFKKDDIAILDAAKDHHYQVRVAVFVFPSLVQPY
jgi:NADPH-dependent 2,4-dienoyl-CoA reductase/sulfur reductase-like enzyme